MKRDDLPTAFRQVHFQTYLHMWVGMFPDRTPSSGVLVRTPVYLLLPRANTRFWHDQNFYQMLWLRCRHPHPPRNTTADGHIPSQRGQASHVNASHSSIRCHGNLEALRLIIADSVSVVPAIKRASLRKGPEEARMTNPEALHQQTKQQAFKLSYFRLHSRRRESLN